MDPEEELQGIVKSAEELTLNEDEQLSKEISKIRLSEPDDQLNTNEAGGTGDHVCGNAEKMEQRHPLMIDLILKKFMSHLSWSQLRDVRLVNRHWNAHAIPYLRTRHHPIEFEDDEDISDFKNVLENTSQFPFGDFDFDTYGKQQKDFLNKFGNHIVELSIWSKKFTIHHLQEVFSTCRDLEYFSMRTTPFLTPEVDILFDLEEYEMTNLKTLVFRGESDLGSKIYNQRLVNHMLKLTPNVKSLRFDCSKELVPKVFEAMQFSPLMSLQKLDIQVGVSEEDIKILSECKGLALKNLKLGHARIKSNHELFTNFLATQPSLTELCIYTISLPRNEDGTKPPAFFFPTMPNLKRLIMDEVYQGNDHPHLVDFVDIDFSKKFPKLEKLEVLEDAFCKHLRDSRPAENVESLSISLAGTQQFCLHEYWRIRDMFPNLRKLTLVFITSPWLTMGVFKYMTNLTHLTIEDGALYQLDSTFTGISGSDVEAFADEGESASSSEASIQRYLELRDRPSLTAMTYLRHLKIEQADDKDDDDDDDYDEDEVDENGKPFPRRCCRTVVSDVSVYLALLQIKPLECLEISESTAAISDRGLRDLKAYHKKVRIF